MFHKVLVTGAAGFIGKHVVSYYLSQGCEVIGIDNLNDFTYSASIKYDRLESVGLDTRLMKLGGLYSSTGKYTFHIIDIADGPTVEAMIIDGGFDLIVHLSGMTSVSASSLSPSVFFRTNVDGFLNVLDGVRALTPETRPRLVWASSAAVYGNSDACPFRDDDKNILHPGSIYGATKCMMEDAAEAYASLYGVRSVALRFFNIYGPFERPDTLISNVAYDLIHDETLNIYGNGKAAHDYMYIDDCVEAIEAVARIYLPDDVDYDAYNIGTQNPYSCLDIIAFLEEIAGHKLNAVQDPNVPQGETSDLSGDVSRFQSRFGVVPRTDIKEGLRRNYEWFRNYYRA